MTLHTSTTSGAGAPAEGDAVAIVGVAGVFPGAATADALWRNVVAGVDAISEVPPGRWDPLFFDADAKAADRFYCRRGGFVDDVATFDPLAFGIMPVTAESCEPDQLLALGAARAALSDAGDVHERLDPRKVSVVLGRGGYVGDGVARLDQRVRTANQLATVLAQLLPDLGEDRIRRVKEEFQDALGPERPEGSIGLVPNLAASRIANRFDFRGPAYTVDAACASSLIAVDQGVAQLLSGQADLVLAGGVHHCHDLTLWSVFSQLRALSPSGGIRPFSEAADGILVGEGTGILALRRLSDALRDGDRVYAVIRGTGVASDGRASSLMSPQADGQTLAVEAAWRASGLDPAHVGLVEAHGTATPLGDRTELETLRAVFGGPDSRPRAGLGSIKSMIGHAMPAAGAAGLIKTALALHHRTLPPTLHVEEPNAAVADTRFRLVTEAEPWESDGVRLAGVNAFGFGGINAHVVLGEAPGGTVGAVDPVLATPRSEPVAQTVTEPVGDPVLLLAGPDTADLIAQLDRLREDDLTPEALRVRPVPTGGPARLAIVAPDSRRLTLAAKVLARGTAFRGRNDVWFDPVGVLREGRLAFLYPGVEPGFSADVSDVAAHFGLAATDLPGGGGSTVDAPSTDELQEQGRGILALGRLLTSALDRLAVRPDEIAGHSLGEWTGQVVSSMVAEDAVEAFLSDLRPGGIEVPDVVFVALGAGADMAERIVADLPDAHVSHDNCPHQSVVCAPEADAAVILDRAKHHHVMAQTMPFRSGFHSPLFAPFVERLSEQFSAIEFSPASPRLWSATSAAPYPDDPDEIRALSSLHLVEKVRFRELVERLHDEGVRGFVQVGVGSLTGFLDDTLREADVVSVPAHTERRTGMDQLLRVAVALWSAGREVDLDALTTPPVGTVVEPASVVEPVETGTPLRLGSPLVRGLAPLDLPTRPAVEPSRVEPVETGRPAVEPVETATVWHDAFKATLDEATAAAADVLEAAKDPKPITLAPGVRRFVRRPAGPGVSTGSTTEASSTTGASSTAEGSRETVRHLSVAEQPYWADHAFYPQRAGWDVLEDRFPLVPLTGLIEMMAEEAEALVPGTRTVAIENVRAFKWLAVEPAVDARFRASVDVEATAARTDGVTVVRTSIEGHARAVVLLGPAYPTPPMADRRTLTGRLDPPPLERVYADCHLFHGPEYQGLRSLDHFADDGASGELESQSAPGALLDNAGQLFGLWVATRVDRDRLVLPTSVERFEFFGPHPEPGESVDCVVHCTELAEQHVRADLELVVDGQVWCRITGWEDRRFQSDDRLFALLRGPSDHLLAEAQPGGWHLVREGWPDSASREVVMRRFLGQAERPGHWALNPRAQRAHLLGRIAAKDAVRDLLAGGGTPDCFPAELVVANADSGQPYVTSPVTDRLAGRDVRLSIAHSGGVGVAYAAEGRDTGIDVERVAERSETFEATSLGTDERALLAQVLAGSTDPARRDLELTRWWAAKEAVAKANGTGLGFRPKDIAVTQVDGERLYVAGRWVATTVVSGPGRTSTPTSTLTAPEGPGGTAGVPPHSPEEYVVAWTEHAPQPR
ncbi:MAG: beta-ketoacyl synthase N-terminal-like domain-containing protein [Nocardioides sp.]|uniref:beta-ketoacyl synthase N-terminal-like domain-containing protein n=1 Tax=Nocardioides sp. TaxID=35761 RepID=UPI003EFE4911